MVYQIRLRVLQSVVQLGEMRAIILTADIPLDFLDQLLNVLHARVHLVQASGAGCLVQQLALLSISAMMQPCHFVQEDVQSMLKRLQPVVEIGELLLGACDRGGGGVLRRSIILGWGSLVLASSVLLLRSVGVGRDDAETVGFKGVWGVG